MSIVSNPNDHQLSPDELLKLFAPDINRNVKGDKIDNLPQVFRNIGSIIAVEGRRALEFIKHPDKGFLTNRKILERLKEIKGKKDDTSKKVNDAFVGKLERRINKSDSKYEENHRKHDIIDKINGLRDARNVAASESFAAKEQVAAVGDKEFDTDDETDTLDIGIGEGNIPEQPQRQWRIASVDRNLPGNKSFLDAHRPIPANEEPPPANLPRNIERIESRFQSAVEPWMFTISTEHIEILMDNYFAFIQSEDIQRVVPKLEAGTFFIQLDEIYLQRMLEGLPDSVKEEVGDFLRPLTLQIVKREGEVKYTLPQLANPEFQEMLSLLKFPPQFEMIQDKEGITTLGWPNVKFGTEELQQFISNLNLVIQSKDIQEAFGKLKLGNVELKLSDTQIERLVKGLPKKFEDLIAKQLQKLIIQISQGQRGILFTLLEQANRARLGNSIVYNQTAPQILAATLAPLLKQLIPEDTLAQFRVELARGKQVLDFVGRKRVSLLRELQEPEMTPARVREIRRELIGLRKQVESSISQLQVNLKKVQANATEAEKRECGDTIAKLALELRRLIITVRPTLLVHQGVVGTTIGMSRFAPTEFRFDAPINHEAFEPIRNAIDGMVTRKNKFLGELNDPSLSMEDKREILGSLRNIFQEAERKKTLYEPQLQQFQTNSSVGHQAVISRVLNNIMRTISEVSEAIKQLESDLAMKATEKPTVPSFEKAKIGISELTETSSPIADKTKPRSSVGVRPSLTMLALLTVTMFLKDHLLMAGQGAFEALSTPTPGLFTPFTSVNDMQLGTNTFVFESEDNRGYPYYLAEEQEGFSTLLDNLNQGTPKESVRAAIVMADTAMTPMMRLEAIARLFDNQANYDYLRGQTNKLVEQTKAGDLTAKTDLRKMVDKAKEALLARQSNEFIKQNAASLLCKISGNLLFVPEIVTIPSQLVYPALNQAYSTVAGYNVIKREADKGADSYLSREQLSDWSSFVYLTETTYRMFNRDLSSRTPSENVEGILKIMNETLKTYEIDLEFGYPHVFENKEASEYLRDTCSSLLENYSSQDDWQTTARVKAIFELAKYGVLTRPEAKGPREIIELFVDKGVFLKEIAENKLQD